MLNTKFDQAFDERCVNAIEWLNANTYADADAEGLRVAALNLVQKGYDRFADLRDLTQFEQDDYNAAAVALSQADGRAERAFQTLTYRVQAKKFEKRATSEEAFERFQAAANQGFGNVMPSAFAAMDVDTSLDVLKKATAFARTHLGASDPDILAAQDAHAELDRCRRVARGEESEYATAMADLVAARDYARTHYTAAREVLSAALRLVGSKHLGRIMPPLYTIYKSATPATSADASPAPSPETPIDVPPDASLTPDANLAPVDDAF